MHVFITGGTRGIGNALVHEFVKNGHEVSFTGTSRSSIAGSGSEGTRSKGFVLDVRSKDVLKPWLNRRSRILVRLISGSTTPGSRRSIVLCRK